MDVLTREEEEDPSDIRNYLASFHKEIVKEDESDSFVDPDSDEDCGVGEDGLYGYISENELDEAIQIKEEPEEDEDDPNFFPIPSSKEKVTCQQVPARRKGAEIIRLGVTRNLVNEADDLSDEDNQNLTIVPGLDDEVHLDDPHTLEMVAQLAEQAVSDVAKNSQLSDIERGGSYQTVTIVPSDTNPGELSYVLFVSENDDGLEKIDEDGAMSIFDATQFGETFLTKQVETSGRKMRTIRLSTRRSQLAIQQHVCAYCTYTSPKRYLLSRHMKCHSEERPHKCGVCGRGFKTLASLQNHVNTHTGTRPHPCKECNSCFTTSGELVRHVRYKHTHEKPHKCTECDYASVELSKLKRHIRCHTGERPYQCPHCTYASPDTYKLKRHLRIHTGEKPYECDVCQTRFTQSNSLKAHKLIHSGNKPVFKCEYCPTTCGRKTDLRIHMEKMHSSDNPHKCNRCGKVFLDRYSYKVHVKSHDGEKCFKCDLCDYASVSHRHLETHMLVHTDQKPFQCDECDMSFRQKQLLKRHKNLYHDPYYVPPEPKEKTHICAVCSKAFRHKGNLLRHYVVHDPDASVSEKESASRPGDGEEEGEEEEEEEYEEGEEQNEKEDQEVVVFEVIQLPSANGRFPDNPSFTMVDGAMSGELNGEPYSIIQSVDGEEEELFAFAGKGNALAEDSTLVDVAPTPCKRRNKVQRNVVRLKKRSQGNNSVAKLKSKTALTPPSSHIIKVTAKNTVSAASDIDYLDEQEADDEGTEKMQNDLKECFDFSEKDDLLSTVGGSAFSAFQGQMDGIS